jgi:hypothetical protein
VITPKSYFKFIVTENKEHVISFMARNIVFITQQRMIHEQ